MNATETARRQLETLNDLGYGITNTRAKLPSRTARLIECFSRELQEIERNAAKFDFVEVENN